VASIADSGVTRWPRRQILVPFPFSWPCAPPWHLLWIFTASNRPPRTNPKLTSARLTSGNHSPPLLEAIGPADHAPELPTPLCTPCTCSAASGRSRTPPESTIWPLPHRRQAGTLAPRWDLPPLSPAPLDPDPMAAIDHLTQSVWNDPDHQIPFRSNGSGSRSGRTGISQWHHTTWPVSRGKIENRFRNWQNYVQTLENHIFWSVIRKIANDMPLESLEHLESSGTIKLHILWVQFETIFKLESNHLLACLNHIFSFVSPKITNL
jgi:hypothetical protein